MAPFKCPTFRQGLALFVLSLLLPIASFATGPTCESSTMTAEVIHLEQDFHGAAQALARFRTSIQQEKNNRKKSIAAVEFDQKFQEFEKAVGSRDRAMTYLRRALQEIGQTDSGTRSEKQEATRQEKEEKKTLEKWAKTKHLALFPNDVIEGFWMPADQSKIVVTSHFGRVAILDFKTKEVFKAPYRHREKVTDVAFSPDGKKIVTVSEQDGNVRILDLDSQQLAPVPYTHSYSIKQAKISPDGQWLVTAGSSRGGGSEVKALDLHTMIEKTIPDQSIQSISHVLFSPDGSQLVLVDYEGFVRILKVPNMEVVELHDESNPGKSWVNYRAITPDSSHFVVGTANGLVRVFDLKHPEKKPFTYKHNSSIAPSGISADGSTLVTVSHNKEVIIHRLPTMELIPNHFSVPENIKSLMISPDGSKFTTMTYPGFAKTYNLTDQSEKEMPENFLQSIQKASISPDGSELVAVAYSGQVQMLDTQSLNLETFPFQHHANMNAYHISPDHSKVFTGDRDGGVVIWFRDAEEAASWDSSN